MPVLKTVVDPETKSRFARLARNRGLSESELLRSIIFAEAKMEPGQSLGEGAQPDGAEVERITVRAARFVLDAAKERSAARGMAVSRYVAALLQSNVLREPVMTTVEIAVLLASNRELAAIGRNINQIAHALNIAFDETERVKIEQMGELRAVIDANRDAVRGLIRASRNAWGIE